MIAGKDKQCSGCRLDGLELDACASAKTLMERYGENVIIQKKLLKWDGKPAVLVSARNMQMDFEDISVRVNEQMEEAYSVINMYDRVYLSDSTEEFLKIRIRCWLWQFQWCN